MLNSGNSPRTCSEVISKNVKSSCFTFAKAQRVLDKFWKEKSSICSSASCAICPKSASSLQKSLANAQAVFAKFCGLKIAAVTAVLIFLVVVSATARCSFGSTNTNVAKAQMTFERPWGVKPSTESTEAFAKAVKSRPQKSSSCKIKKTSRCFQRLQGCRNHQGASFDLRHSEASPSLSKGVRKCSEPNLHAHHRWHRPKQSWRALQAWTQGLKGQLLGLSCAAVLAFQRWQNPRLVFKCCEKQATEYPLVNIQKTMGNHHFSWENPL